jgi:hypothetical protein
MTKLNRIANPNPDTFEQQKRLVHCSPADTGMLPVGKLTRNHRIICSPGRASRARGNRDAHFVRALFQGAKRALEQGTSPDGSVVKPAACRPLRR